MAKNRNAGKKHRTNLQSGTVRDPVVTIRYSVADPPRQMRMSEAMRLAFQFSDQSNERAAQAIYQQILRQCPTQSEPAAALLHSLHAIGQTGAAQMLAYQMLSTMKNDANAIDQVAAFYLSLEKTEEALKVVDKGLKDCPPESCAVLHRRAGNIHELMGDTGRAISCYETALSIDDSDVNTLFQLTNLNRDKSGDWLVGKLLAVSKQKDIPPNKKPFLYFSLAYLHENKDNEKYFNYLKIANDSVRRDSTLYFKRQQEFFNAISSVIADDNTSTTFHHQSTSKAPIFIVSTPRSGTTLLAQILSAHPDVENVGESGAFPSACSQLHDTLLQMTTIWSWDDDTQKQSAEKLRRFYYGHQRIPDMPGKIFVDKTFDNHYLLGMVLLAWPDARIIWLRRNPLDTIMSCYHHFFAGGFDRFFDLKSLARYYLIVKKYMELWQSHYPGNILSMEYESLVQDQEGQIRRLLEFCKLPWDDACLRSHENVGLELTASNLQVRQPINGKSIEKWKPFRSQLEPAIDILEHEMGRSLVS